MRLFLLYLLTTFWVGINFGQSLYPGLLGSAGDFVNHPNGSSISWSLGEPVVAMVSADGFTLNQGFQQSFLARPTSWQDPSFNYTVEIYPNPAVHLLHIDTDHDKKMQYRIITLVGKNVKTGTFEKHAEIDINPLPSGTYIVNLQSHRKAVMSTVFVKM